MGWVGLDLCGANTAFKTSKEAPNDQNRSSYIYSIYSIYAKMHFSILATTSKAIWFETSESECEKCWNSKLLPTPAAPELILTNDVSWLELGGSNRARNWHRVLCCTIFSMLYNIFYAVQYCLCSTIHSSMLYNTVTLIYFSDIRLLPEFDSYSIRTSFSSSEL